MERLLNLFYINFDGTDEFQISDNLSTIFLTLGDCLLGDKKLFKFSGRKGYVRIVPNKPTKILLCNFQSCIQLECGLPYMIYTRMQAPMLEMHHIMKCHDIIKDWASLIVEREKSKKQCYLWTRII